MMFLPIIILVVLLFVFVSPSARGNNIGFRRDEYSDKALDILDKRFANGEINEEEYLKKRNTLRNK